MTVTTEAAGPTGSQQGRVYFLVSQELDSNRGYEPEFRPSYDLQRVTVAVADMSFETIVDAHSAWIAETIDVPVLIAAMQAAPWLRVAATSSAGAETQYTFSLQGFGAALDSLDACANKFISAAARTGYPATTFVLRKPLHGGGVLTAMAG